MHESHIFTLRRLPSPYLIEHLYTAPAPPCAVVNEVRSIRLPLPQESSLEELVDLLDRLGGVHLARGLLDREG